MGSHEEFLELCAAATAGELTADEQAKLAAHLAVCSECRRAKSEYDAAAIKGAAALAESHGLVGDEAADSAWSIDEAEKKFFQRLEKEEREDAVEPTYSPAGTQGKRLAYRPSQIHWREIWMSFAAAILLTIALGVAVYRSGVKHGTDVARTSIQPANESVGSLEAQVSDAGHERALLEAKLGEDAKQIEDLRRQLSEQINIVNSLKPSGSKALPAVENGQQANKGETSRSGELQAAQTKLAELQKKVDAATGQRDENARQAAALEVRVNELTQLVRAREQTLDEKDAEVARQQELLEHDRDIRELMGARELYMADVYDVSGKGTDTTYGRVFYTRGKRLIFYAFDLDTQPGVQNASTFQAWGRKGPDKQQARSLGIFYEDNASKKRWILKAEDPKALADIDAVFVTVEPHGGSQRPTGKQLLFAYLRISPNHP
jgi:hypothetical protein